MSPAGSGFFGQSNYQSPDSRALTSITQSQGVDSQDLSSAEKMGELLQRHDYQLKYLASQTKQLQQGVNDATQNPAQQLQQFISDLVVLFGGGELAQGLLDFGDLKYLLPAIGALFGFGSGPYPVNLLQAAEKFFLGYIVPSEQYSDLLNHFIDEWAGFFGINPQFVKDVNSLVTAVAELFDGVKNLLPNMQSLFSELGISGRDLGPLGQKLAPIIHLFSGIDLTAFDDAAAFVTAAMDRFIVHLTAVINFIDEVIRILGAGGDVVNSPLPGITLPFSNLVKFLGNVRLAVEDFDPLGAAQQFVGRLLLPVSGISSVQPDLQVDSGFDDSTSLVADSAAWDPGGDTAWVYDAAVGHTADGSVKIVADGDVHELLGTIIPIVSGQTISVGAWVSWSGLSASGSPLAVQLQTDIATNIAVDAVASPGASAGFTHLSGSYTITDTDITDGVTNVRTRLLVDAGATAGTVWFDDAPIRRSNLMPQDLIHNLVDQIQYLALTGLYDVSEGFENLGSSLLKNLTPSGGGLGEFDSAHLVGALNTALTISGNNISSLFNGSGALASALTGALNTGVTISGNAISTLFNGSGALASALTGALNTGVTISGNAISALFNSSGVLASVVNGALNTAVTISGNAISTLFNGSGALASALTGAINTGVTISGNAISTLFSGSGVLASALTGALNTAVTVSGNAVSALFNASGLIASKIAGALNPAVTFLVGASNVALSTLFGGFDTSGNFTAASLTGALNTAVTIAGTAVSALFNASGLIASKIAGALNPAVTFLVGASNIALSTLLQNLSTTGTLVGSAVTGALNTAVTISGNALSVLFNGSGLIASQIAGALNTAVTISGNAVSTLFNGSGALASALTGAVNTAVTISGNALSTLFNGSGLIASQIAGALNPAVTFLVGASNIALSTLLGNLNSTGQFVASAITGALNTAVTISGNAISTLFNGSGLIASQIAGALNTAVTISGNAISALFNSSGLIASKIAGALNPAVTFLVGASNIALSTLLQNLSTTGTLVGSAVTGALNTAVTISGNAISAMFNGSGLIGSFLTGALSGITSLTMSGALSLGGALTGAGTVASSMLTGAISSAIAHGSIPSSLLTAGTLAGAQLTGAVAAALVSGVTTTEQNITDYLHQAVNGGAATGNAVTTIKTNLQNVFTNLFGITSLGTVLTKVAVPDVTRDMSSDLQSLNDHIVNSQAGGSGTGNQPADAATALTAIPHSNIVPPSNPGSGISHDADANGTPVTGTSNSLSMSWSHTVGATANYLVVRLGVNANVSPSLAVSYGAQSMTLLNSAGSILTAINVSRVAIYGLLNPAPGTATVTATATLGSGSIWTMQAQSSSYIGVGSIGTSAGIFNNTNSSPSQAFSSSSGDLIVNAIGVIATSSETLSSYSQTSRYNPGSTLSSGTYLAMLAGDAVGAGSVTFSATASFTTANAWCSAAVNLIPIPATVLGSGFRQTRVSTSTVTLAGNPAILPNSYFDTSDKLTSDLTYSSGTANTLTISVAGWYSFTIKLLASTSLGTSNVLVPVLYQNGAVAQWGGGCSAAARDASSSFEDVWCNAGDTMQPGYAVASSISGVGEATGTRSYWGAALANRGILS